MASSERYSVEKNEDWRRWVKEVPVITFKSGWEVRIIPPFAGAMARFLVSCPGTDEEISVYLDCHDALGYMGYPYWEAYPIDGDTARFDMADTVGLVECIDKELNKHIAKDLT